MYKVVNKLVLSRLGWLVQNLEFSLSSRVSGLISTVNKLLIRCKMNSLPLSFYTMCYGLCLKYFTRINLMLFYWIEQVTQFMRIYTSIARISIH